MLIISQKNPLIPAEAESPALCLELITAGKGSAASVVFPSARRVSDRRLPAPDHEGT